MKQPLLNEVSIPQIFPEPGTMYITMSPGQWDTLLQGAYDEGAKLLEIEEIDGQEMIVKAYQKGE